MAGSHGSLGGWQFERTRNEVREVGRALAKGPLDHEQAHVFNQFVRYAATFQVVVSDELRRLGLSPTDRIKTQATTAEKLRRTGIGLDEIQDIVGCRVVLPGEQGRLRQRTLVRRLTQSLVHLKPTVVDRISEPRSGYRALHLVVRGMGVNSEVQVRTHDQHLWAEYYEKLADALGRGIRYGEGVREDLDDPEQRRLAEEIVARSQRMAEMVNAYEDLDELCDRLEEVEDVPEETQLAAEEARRAVREDRATMRAALTQLHAAMSADP